MERTQKRPPLLAMPRLTATRPTAATAARLTTTMTDGKAWGYHPQEGWIVRRRRCGGDAGCLGPTLTKDIYGKAPAKTAASARATVEEGAPTIGVEGATSRQRGQQKWPNIEERVRGRRGNEEGGSSRLWPLRRCQWLERPSGGREQQEAGDN